MNIGRREGRKEEGKKKDGVLCGGRASAETGRRREWASEIDEGGAARKQRRRHLLVSPR